MPEAHMSDLSLESLLAAALSDAGPVVPPIVQTSLFTFANYADFADRMAGRRMDPIYTRVQNPTVAAFETLMAQAEGGQAAVGFASGMAAISSAVLAFVRPGDRIACVDNVYPDAYRFFETFLRPFGVNTTYHPARAFEEDAGLLNGVRLAYLESPTSLVFAPMNLPKVATHAKAAGALTLIDNSWATPIFQRPLESGIDVVVHSASKYISGHSDTVAGVVVGGADHMDTIRALTLPLLGGKLAPFEAFLLTRGLRTLAVRMRAHQATADQFVDRLAGLPCVRKIHAPGRNEVPGLTGRSGLLSVEFDDSIDIPRLCDGMKLFRLGVSWGGFESLIMPARAGLDSGGAVNSLARFGVSRNLVRLSLGLESADDLWSDLIGSLAQSGA
jgi:cystathionine beta-lyase/cystathionine gamma-synthase